MGVEDGGSIPDRGAAVIIVNAVLISISASMVFGRFYVRQWVTRNLGIDDWCSGLALCVLVAQSALDIHMVHKGSGKHMKDVPDEDLASFFKALPTAQLLFYTGSYLARMAILLFLYRLINSYKWLWPGIVGLTVYYLAFFFAFLLQCQPVKALWDRSIAEHCITGEEQALVMYLHSGFGIGIDTALLLIPLIILWRRLMFRRMKFRMIAIFSVGTFAVAAGITRLSIITTIDMASDTTWNTAPAAIWTDVEVHAGLIVGCFPAMHPLYRALRRAITGETSTLKHSQQPGYKTPYSSNTERSGRNPLEMYSIKTKTAAHRSMVGEGDSQENIVEAEMGEDGIYKRMEVEVRVDDRSERGVRSGRSGPESVRSDCGSAEVPVHGPHAV